MIKNILLEKLKSSLDQLGFDSNLLQISHPANESFGDYSTNIALQMAKIEKKSPMVLAKLIADKISPDEYIEKVEIMKPGFINFWITKNKLTSICKDIDSEFGRSETSFGKTFIVEYSSPNIAKPFTIGHLRSTIIGDSIANILEATGAKVYRDNHLGDWGTQFGKLIYAIKTWGNEDEIKNSDNPVKILVELYVKFHTEAEKNPVLEDEGRKWFKKLESGDKEARGLWEKSVEWSWTEFDKLYKKLGIRTEKFENDGRGYGESYFEDKMESVIAELKKNKILTESKGAWLVFYPNDKFPPLMLVKQDGATLYATRDLATDKFRLKKYGDNITIINEVGAEQSLYFQQLYEVETMANWLKKEQRIHIKHGMYRFKEGKMSTRKGNTIWLEDVLKEAERRAFSLSKHDSKFEGPEVISQSNKYSDAAKKNIMGFAQRSNISEVISIGALKWNDLKRSSHLDIVFDWEDVLNMHGNSGPYVQYTYVRCKSLMRKITKKTSGNFSQTTKINDEELALLRSLLKFPQIIIESAENYAPNYICTYLYDLAQKYNFFYQKHQILKEENENIKNLRLLITASVAHVLKHGLGLLGIETVEKM